MQYLMWELLFLMLIHNSWADHPTITEHLIKDNGPADYLPAEELKMNGMMKNAHDGNQLQHKLLTGDFGQGGSTLRGVASNVRAGFRSTNVAAGGPNSTLPPYLRRSLEERGIRPEAVEEKLNAGDFDGAKRLLTGNRSSADPSKNIDQETDALADAILSRYSNTSSGYLETQFHRSVESDESDEDSSGGLPGEDSSKYSGSEVGEKKSESNGAPGLSRPSKVYGVVFASIPFVGETPILGGVSKDFELKKRPNKMQKSIRMGRVAKFRLFEIGIHTGQGPSIFQIARRQYQQWKSYKKIKRLAQNKY